MGDDYRQCLSLCWLSPDLQPARSLIGCTFTVLVHTREAATRNMEKIQVIKVSAFSRASCKEWNSKIVDSIKGARLLAFT